MVLSRMPTDVSKDLPSAAMLIPSSSVGPDVICSGCPSGNLCRQMWNLPPLFELIYTHFPSGDQAPAVQEESAGPTIRSVALPSNGTTRQGSISPRFPMSTTSTHRPSGERYEW